MTISWPADNFADRFFTQEIYERNDPRFRRLATEVFVRDKFQCSFCKFSCKPTENVWNAYFQLRAKDRNYRNLVSSNLSTICPFCHAYFNLRHAFLTGLYMPGLSDIPPERLSVLCKAAFAMTSRGNAVSDSVELVIKHLKLMTTNLFMVMPELPSPTRAVDAEPEKVKHQTVQEFFSTLVIMAEGNFSANQSVQILKEVVPVPIRENFRKEADFWYAQEFKSAVQSQNMSKFMEAI